MVDPCPRSPSDTRRSAAESRDGQRACSLQPKRGWSACRKFTEMQLRGRVDEEDGALAETYCQSRVLSVAGIFFFFFPGVDFSVSESLKYCRVSDRALPCRLLCAVCSYRPILGAPSSRPRRALSVVSVLTLTAPQRSDRRCFVSVPAKKTCAVAVSIAARLIDDRPPISGF